MGANRRKAVKDRINHREKVKKWHAKLARKVAARLIGGVSYSVSEWEWEPLGKPPCKIHHK